MTGQSSNHLKLTGNGVTDELLFPPINCSAAASGVLAAPILLLLTGGDGGNDKLKVAIGRLELMMVMHSDEKRNAGNARRK